MAILNHMDSDGLITEKMFLVKSPCKTENFKIWHLHGHLGLLMADTSWAAKEVSILVGLLS